MAEYILFRKQQECPSDDINYDENIFNDAPEVWEKHF